MAASVPTRREFLEAANRLARRSHPAVEDYTDMARAFEKLVSEDIGMPVKVMVLGGDPAKIEAIAAAVHAYAPEVAGS